MASVARTVGKSHLQVQVPCVGYEIAVELAHHCHPRGHLNLPQKPAPCCCQPLLHVGSVASDDAIRVKRPHVLSDCARQAEGRFAEPGHFGWRRNLSATADIRRSRGPPAGSASNSARRFPQRSERGDAPRCVLGARADAEERTAQNTDKPVFSSLANLARCTRRRAYIAAQSREHAY
jgi:hypothetical protein